MTDSLLDNLRKQRDALAEAQAEYIPVPCWGTKGSPSLMLKVRPVERRVVLEAQQGVETSGRRKKAEASEKAAAIIVSAAVIKAVFDNDVECTLKDVADRLGLPEGSAGEDVIRELCIRPGDVDALAEKVLELSGFGAEITTIDREFEGE